MNRDDDFIAQLEDYLDTYEGVVPLPATVRDAVHARLPETRQVRGAVGPERTLDMITGLSAAARWGIGIAAVLVVLVGAAVLIPRGATPGIGAAPTPTLAPTPGPSLQPSPSASAPASPSAATGPTPLSEAPPGPCSESDDAPRCMAAGEYRLSSGVWPETISFSVPLGWAPYLPSAENEALLVDSGPTAPEGSGWGTMFIKVGEVSKDPCDASAGRFATTDTATVDGLITAMRSWPGFEVSETQPIEVDGHTGQLVTVTSSRTETDCAIQSMWATPSGTDIDTYPMMGAAGEARAGTFRILGINGALLVIRTTDFGDPTPHELNQGVKPDPTRHAADQVEMQGILDSIQIGP